MKIELENYTLTVISEPGDKKYYGTVNAKGESNFLYDLKKELNKKGFDLIKTRMGKDGHLVDDIQQYLRVKSKSSKTPHIYIYNPRWANAGANDYWNEYGKVELGIDFDIYGVQPNCQELAKALF